MDFSFVGALAFVLVLAGLIFFHELGHFLAARLMGIGVRTFSIGFGKALVSWQGKSTRYQISMIPLGGYVDLVGMRKDEEIAAPFTKDDAYSSRGPAARLFTVVAGPLFNIVLAWFIYWGLMMGGGSLLLPEVGKVMPDSPAARAGILPGDTIVSINGAGVTYWEDVLFNVQSGEGGPLDVQINRQGRSLVFSLTPDAAKYTDDKGVEKSVFLMGVVASGNYMQRGFFEAGVEGFKAAWSKTVLMADLVRKMFTGGISFKDNVGGPVMVAQAVHNQAASAGLDGVLKLAALLSVNLGLLNLLPIPALDGGHVMFNLIELVFRRPVPEKIQANVSYYGFLFLIGLMILATALDVFRIVT